MPLSSPMFTPPKTKGRPDKQPCPCDWGETCCQLQTFFGARNHALGGYVELKYNPNSCDFMNLWKAAIKYLHIPQSYQDELAANYQSNNTPPKVRISRFHFPVELVMQHKPAWLTPMTRGEAEQLGCYKDLSPPAHEDALIKYNSTLGKGQSDRMKKRHAGNVQLRKVPCASRNDVTAFAGAMQQQVSPVRRLDLDSRRERHNIDQAQQQIRRDTVAAEARSPDEWTTMLSRKEAETSALQSENEILKAEVEQLLKQLNEKDQALLNAQAESKKYKKRAYRSQSALECAEKEIEAAREAVFQQFMILLSKSGGLSRLTIFNDEWHKRHKDAARLLYGYKSWEEAKLYVCAYFDGEVFVTDPSKNIDVNKDGDMLLPSLSAFEQCLLCKMFFRCFTLQPINALIMDKHRTTIGKILKVWAPKWANVGEALCCLDITADYLVKEVPDININLGRPEMVYTDGKDANMSPKRNDNALAKSTFSSKTNKDAARMLTFSTAAGLIFELTRMFGARVGERKLVEYLSSLGPVNAPVEDWEDVANLDPWDPKVDDAFYTALNDMLTPAEMEELLNKIDLEMGESAPSIVNGLNDDGVLLTAQSSGLEREGIFECDVDSDGEEGEGTDADADCNTDRSKKKAGRDIYGICHALKDFEMMRKCHEVEKNQRAAAKRKMPPILSVDTLREQNLRALQSGPNHSGKFKCRQLEIHQRLHILYESGQLSKCLLSYFLLVATEDRLKLLSWFGSQLASDTPKPSKEDLPKVPLRLAKIPEEFDVGADKGFTDISYMLPNLNFVETPYKLDNSKTQHKSEEQILADIPLTTCRAPTETIFRRNNYNAIMQEPIPYWLLSFIAHGHMVAHGESNLYNPLRYPGRYAIVTEDYWKNKVDYTLIERPKRPHVNVESSARRKCSRCGQGGIVMICEKCKNWYHRNGQCHDSEDCNGIHNPYLN